MHLVLSFYDKDMSPNSNNLRMLIITALNKSSSGICKSCCRSLGLTQARRGSTTRQSPQLWKKFWKASIAPSLPTDRQAQGKPTQWRVETGTVPMGMTSQRWRVSYQGLSTKSSPPLMAMTASTLSNAGIAVTSLVLQLSICQRTCCEDL